MTRKPHTNGWEPARSEGPAPADQPTGPDADPAGRQDTSASWARADRRGFRQKLAASLRGIKYAIRGDSSFFAHMYRFLLIALTAALLGVGPLEWCFLSLAAALVFMAELLNSAVDTLARALGDPEEPGIKMAREIATGGVLVAVTVSAALSILVLTLKLGVLLGWWRQ
jgi:diacylglycerol kinase